MHPLTKTWLGVLAMVLAACEGQGSGRTLLHQRDSAGVTVVENRRPAWADGEGWRLADTPSADVGGLDAPPQERLDDVVAVARTELGVIAVANAGTQEIRLYSRIGRFIRSLGGRSGPVTFAGLVWTAAAGDSIAGYDIVTHRLAVFGIPGVRTVKFQAAGPFAMPLARFEDGGLLFAVQGGTFPFSGAPGEVRRDSAALLRYAADGAVRDTIGRFAWGETFGVPLGPAGATFVAPFPRPLSARGSAAVAGGRIVVGSGISYELAIYGGTGRLERLVRRAHEPRAVTPEVIAAYRAAAPLPPAAESLASFPATMPAYERILADPDGYLWVLDYDPAPASMRAWSIFDPDGLWLGTVTMPAGFRLAAVGRREVVGLWRDANGAEHLRVYPVGR